MVCLPLHPNLPLGQKLGLDMDGMLHHARLFYADRFVAAETPLQLAEALDAAVVAQGGTLIVVPNPHSNWGPTEFELSLLGCTATGGTRRELVGNWIKAATRMSQEAGIAA